MSAKVELNEFALKDRMLSTFRPENYEAANRLALFEAKYEPYTCMELTDEGDGVYKLICRAYHQGNENPFEVLEETISNEPAVKEMYIELAELDEKNAELDKFSEEIAEFKGPDEHYHKPK